MNRPTESSRKRRSRNVFSEFTGFFLRNLVSPNDERPTVRCISKSDALKLAGAARAALDDPELRRASAEQLLELLEKSGVLERLTSGERSPTMSIYAVGPTTTRTIEPMELLMAAVPGGVICYFTALAYYGLTTQLATHHHVAKLNVASKKQPARGRPPDALVRNLQSKPRRNLLGTRLFEFDGLSYYETARARHTLAGVQQRQLNDRSIIRITTREQTLLDTLLRPHSCGGPTVVWEAWSHPMTDFDLARFTKHLEDLNDPKLSRRVGYMLAQLGQTDYPHLMQFLRRSLPDSALTEPIPLLPGLSGGQVDPVWRVQVASM